MTLNSKTVLNYLKEHYGVEVTKDEIVHATGVSLPAVTGSINGLRKREFVTERCETVIVEPATETRKAKEKIIRYEMLTDAGLAFDPEAEEAAIAAEKAAKKAEREAAKAAKAAE